jgi:hypothetical protein
VSDASPSEARTLARDVGEASQALHTLVTSPKVPAADVDLASRFDAVSILGDQAAFLFEDSADLPGGVPSAAARDELAKAADQAASALERLRSEMVEQGRADCWADADLPAP